MHADLDKNQENQSFFKVNNLESRQNQTSTHPFVDNRPQALEFRRLQEMANNSPKAKEAAQLKAMLDQRFAEKHPVLQRSENNEGLPAQLKSGIENLSGYAMDDVKVHRNSEKPAQINAHAYAQGTDIHLASGQEKHLPHEAWHVAQQKQGRVKPTVQMKGTVNINDDTALEREADIMGAKANTMAAQGGTSTPNLMTKSVDGFVSQRQRQELRKVYAPTAGADNSVLGEVRIEELKKRSFLKGHQSALNDDMVAVLKTAVDAVRSKIGNTIDLVEDMKQKAEAGISNGNNRSEFRKAENSGNYLKWASLSCFGISCIDEEGTYGEPNEHSHEDYSAWLREHILQWLNIVLAVYEKTKTKLVNNLVLKEARKRSKKEKKKDQVRGGYIIMNDKKLFNSEEDNTIRNTGHGGSRDTYSFPFDLENEDHNHPIYLNYKYLLEEDRTEKLEDVLVHEATHSAVGTRDNEYVDDNPKNRWSKLTPAQGTANADSYAYFYRLYH